MALVVKDRVKETSTTAGTGTLTLAGASSGFRSFADIGNANTTYYAIVDNTDGTWEVGVGTYTSSGTTLSRDTILSNSSGTTSAINFAANSKDVFVTYPAAAATANSTIDVQTFTGSGTWNKPDSGNFVKIQMWGGGGGGSRSANTVNIGAGGGGGYVELTVPIASMGSTATVTVGAAGTGRTGSAGSGTNGGNSAVTLGSGSIVYVSGGLGAVNNNLGAAGGYGAITFSTTAVADPSGAGSGASSAVPAGDGYSYTGGGGGTATNNVGGKGGYGGGGGTRGTATGNTSIFGGNGGTASVAGTQPGGGGGASSAVNTNATNGGAGQVIITTF